MLTITLSAGGYTAIFAPMHGGACISLKKDDYEILNTTEDEGELGVNTTRYGFPLLVPPNRLDGGSFTFEGTTCKLPIKGVLNTSCHGLIHQCPWQVEGYTEDEESAEIHLVYEVEPGTPFYECWPYEFEVEQIYTLDAEGLHQEVRVTNFTEKRMPLGLGWHSAFALHAGANETITVDLGKRVVLSERILPTGELADLDDQENAFRSLTGQDPVYRVLDDLFTAEPITLDGASFHGAIVHDPAAGLDVYYRVDDFYKHWVIWNNKQDGRFVCIEPQNWRTNAPNLPIRPEESGMSVVEPGETLSITADVYVKAR